MTDKTAVRLDGVAKRFHFWKRASKRAWWRRERNLKVALEPLDLEVATGGVTGFLGLLFWAIATSAFLTDPSFWQVHLIPVLDLHSLHACGMVRQQPGKLE